MSPQGFNTPSPAIDLGTVRHVPALALPAPTDVLIPPWGLCGTVEPPAWLELRAWGSEGEPALLTVSLCWSHADFAGDWPERLRPIAEALKQGAIDRAMLTAMHGEPPDVRGRIPARERIPAAFGVQGWLFQLSDEARRAYQVTDAFAVGLHNATLNIRVSRAVGGEIWLSPDAAG